MVGDPEGLQLSVLDLKCDSIGAGVEAADGHIIGYRSTSDIEFDQACRACLVVIDVDGDRNYGNRVLKDLRLTIAEFVGVEISKGNGTVWDIARAEPQSVR